MSEYRCESTNPYYLFHDIETTGFDEWRNAVLQWAGIVTDKKLNILDKKLINFRPESNERWDEGAEEVHGISEFTAHRFPQRREGFINMLNFLKPFKTEAPLTVIEHSVNSFDIKRIFVMSMKENALFSLRKVMQRKHQLSTREMAVKHTGQRKNNGLDRWAEEIGFDLKHHDPESDVMCTLELFKYFRQRGI